MGALHLGVSLVLSYSRRGRSFRARNPLSDSTCWADDTGCSRRHGLALLVPRAVDGGRAGLAAHLDASARDLDLSEMLSYCDCLCSRAPTGGERRTPAVSVSDFTRPRRGGARLLRSHLLAPPPHQH